MDAKCSALIGLFTLDLFPFHTGLCSAAGYTECCTEGTCVGYPQDCYCDNFCANLGDCCRDHADICTIGMYAQCSQTKQYDL